MAVAASACCLGPLLLLSLGIGGAWIGVWLSHLSALEHYRAPLIVATLLCIGVAFRQLYLTPSACDAQGTCAVQPSRKLLQLLFWILTPILLALLTSNAWIPLLYR